MNNAHTQKISRSLISHLKIGDREKVQKLANQSGSPIRSRSSRKYLIADNVHVQVIKRLQEWILAQLVML